MSCRDVRNRVQRLLDGEPFDPPADERAHLDLCPACRRELAAARLLLDGVRGLPPAPPVTRPAEQLVALIQTDREVRRRRVWYRWYATVALAASVLLIAGLGNLVSLWNR